MSKYNSNDKLKECEKKDKYVDHVRELKKLWNRRVTIIPIYPTPPLWQDMTQGQILSWV